MQFEKLYEEVLCVSVKKEWEEKERVLSTFLGGKEEKEKISDTSKDPLIQ